MSLLGNFKCCFLGVPLERIGCLAQFLLVHQPHFTYFFLFWQQPKGLKKLTICHFPSCLQVQSPWHKNSTFYAITIPKWAYSFVFISEVDFTVRQKNKKDIKMIFPFWGELWGFKPSTSHHKKECSVQMSLCLRGNDNLHAWKNVDLSTLGVDVLKTAICLCMENAECVYSQHSNSQGCIYAKGFQLLTCAYSLRRS